MKLRHKGGTERGEGERERKKRKRERQGEGGRATYLPVSASHTATVLSKDPVSTVSPVVLNPRQITSAE